MESKKTIVILILCIISITQVFSQKRFDVEYDTVKKTCHIYEINNANKTFAEHIISDCRRACFFDDNKLLVYFDSFGDAHFCNLSSGFITLKEPVLINANIKEILNVKQFKPQKAYTQNGEKTNENLYSITYIDSLTHKTCVMEVDKLWFMIFSQKCE